MTEVKAVERRRAQLFYYLRISKRYWELEEETEDRKGGNNSLSHEHKDEI